jgi:DNA-binding NtrC family response regulator
MEIPLDKVVFVSPVMQALRQELKPLAEMAAPLLFWGETGAGMGFLARMVHASSSRAGAFLKIPGFMLDEDTVVQQFIGVDDQPGWLEEADQGTIFLKRVSEAPLPVQKTLLSLLSNQSADGDLDFSRKGRSDAITVNVRFLYSIAHDLTTALQDGLLQRGLADQITARGKILRFPPLRERPEDMPGIVRNFLDEFNHKHGRAVTAVDEAGLALFRAYAWPGNIDELKRVIDTMFTQYPDCVVVTAAHVPERITQAQIMGTEYRFKLKDDAKFTGQLRSHFLKIQSGSNRLKLNTNDLAGIVRVEDPAFSPPKFKHFLLKFKDGGQMTGTPLDKTLKVAASFDDEYVIALQDVESIDLI